jgi:hypothetical protein
MIPRPHSCLSSSSFPHQDFRFVHVSMQWEFGKKTPSIHPHNLKNKDFDQAVRMKADFGCAAPYLQTIVSPRDLLNPNSLLIIPPHRPRNSSSLSLTFSKTPIADPYFDNGRRCSKNAVSDSFFRSSTLPMHYFLILSAAWAHKSRATSWRIEAIAQQGDIYQNQGS